MPGRSSWPTALTAGIFGRLCNSYRDAQIGDMGFLAGGKCGRDMLEGTRSIAADDDTQFGIFSPCGRKLSGEFRQRNFVAIERHAALVADGYHVLLGCRAERRRGSNLGQFELDVALHFGKLCRDHKEDDQQEHDIDHRRQVEPRLVVLLRF